MASKFGSGNFANFNLGRLLEDILGLAQTLKTEGQKQSSRARGPLTAEFERVAKKLNLVTREEFEAVKAIAIAARTQAEDVASHVGMKKKTVKKPAAKKAPAKKPAAKKKK